jgi:hypothetical protein
MIMREQDEPARGASERDEADQLRTRRAMLRIGALGAAAIVTVKPGMAQAAASAMTCSVPVPQATDKNKWIAADGSLVNKNTSGAFTPPSNALAGEDVKNAIKYGTSYPGYAPDASSAYTNYIKKLTIGQQGYTCYASLQSPSRQ